MQAEDLLQVCEIEKANFARPWKLADFQLVIEDPISIYVVAKIDEKVVGVAGLYHIFGEGNITNVSVLSEFRGQKIAERMLLQLFEVAREKEVIAFTLEVRESNQAAIRVYEKLGFITEGVRKSFYDRPIENALILWKR